DCWTIEHRLQMVDDRQTHSIPTDPAALDNVARLHGVGDGGELLELLRPRIARVSSIYDQLAPEGQAGLPTDPQSLEQWLADAGFDDPGGARKRIEGWRQGTARSLRTA